MAERQSYEFGYMVRRERIKLILLKIACILSTTGFLLLIIFGHDKVSAQLAYAGASVAGPFLYVNLCHVKSEVMELFEPPYPIKGHGLAIIGTSFVLASIYFTLMGQ